MKHISPLLALSLILAPGDLAVAVKGPVYSDLLALGEGAWQEFDREKWHHVDGVLVGDTGIYDGAITDPDASAFLVTREIFNPDIGIVMDITFETGRYVGVYIGFDQETQTGIWMATGHALPDAEKEHHVESGYLKTVENGHWIVRATGELVIEPGATTTLGFYRSDDFYRLLRNEVPVILYPASGRYPPAPVQIRLTNAKARITRLLVVSEGDRL